MEYAGGFPAIAMITESNPLSAPWRRPRSLLDIHISWGWGRAVATRSEDSGPDPVRCVTDGRNVHDRLSTGPPFPSGCMLASTESVDRRNLGSEIRSLPRPGIGRSPNA